MAFKHKVLPGETLNTISQKYGFANYKKAGVSSVPSGNFDLIRPGEEITLGNYTPTEIKPFGSTEPVVSSNDGAGEYKSLGTSLDKKLNPDYQYKLASGQIVNIGDPTLNQDMLKGATYMGGGTGADPLAKKEEAGKGIVAGEKEFKSSGDPLYDEMIKSQETGKASSEQWATDMKAQVASLLPKTLAMLDEQYASSVSNITNTYTKLIDEQQKINRMNVDRTTAYGLSSGAQYVPLEFTNAISDQEQKSSDAIAGLENERNDLLAKAKASRDEGKLATLRENMDALNKVEETMRQRTKDLADQVQKRYELTVKVRKEQETKHQESVKKTMDMAKFKYIKNFQNAKDEEEKAKIIRKIILDSAGKLTDEDFYSVYSAMASATATAKELTEKDLKEKADLEYKQAQTAKEKASIKTPEEIAADIEEKKAKAAKDWADAAVKSEEKKKASETKAEMDAMEFKDEADAEKKRKEFVKKYGTDGKKFWDDVYKNDTGLYDYDVETAKGGDIKTRAESAGFNYAKMKSDGYSDEEIDKALKAKGK